MSGLRDPRTRTLAASVASLSGPLVASELARLRKTPRSYTLAACIGPEFAKLEAEVAKAMQDGTYCPPKPGAAERERSGSRHPWLARCAETFRRSFGGA